MPATIPYLRAGPQHGLPVAGAGLGRGAGAHDLFIGVNALDYSGYPDCRPEFIAAFEALARLATKAGVEGQPFRVHAPLIDLTKADIIRLGARAGRRLRPDPQLLRPRPARPGLRALRQLPAARGRLPRGRRPRSARLAVLATS